MKICFVTTNFPRYVGDSEGTFIWEAARAIAGQGHQVRVIAQHWPGYPTHEWMEDVEVIRPRYWWPESKELLRQPGGGIPVVWGKSHLAKIQMLAFIIIQAVAVVRFTRGFDLIHAQWTLSAGIAALTRKIHRCPIVATLQGSDLFQVPRSRAGRFLTRWTLNRTHQITVLSNALFREVVKIGISQDKVKIIPNGVDIHQFFPKESRENTILYVGSLIKRKGVMYLIEAFSMLADKYPEYSLTIVGSGEEFENLQQITRDKGLLSRVIFTGAISPNEVKDRMQQAKVFVLPSLEEGLGVVLLEALACGTPVVASSVGGIKDIVSPGVGLLVSPASPEELMSGMDWLLKNRSNWEIMSKNARRKAIQEYDWTNIARQFVIIYQKLIDIAGG